MEIVPHVTTLSHGTQQLSESNALTRFLQTTNVAEDGIEARHGNPNDRRSLAHLGQYQPGWTPASRLFAAGRVYRQG